MTPGLLLAFDDEQAAAQALAGALEVPWALVQRHRFPDGERAAQSVRPRNSWPATGHWPLATPQAASAAALRATDARTFSLSDLSWPQAARMSRPRGVRMGLA